MRIEDRVRTVLGEAGEAVPDRPGDLEQIVENGRGRGRRPVVWALAAVATAVVVAVAATTLWPADPTVEIEPADATVVAEGQLPQGPWEARLWRQAGELCIEVDHPTVPGMQRCVPPLADAAVGDLAPGGLRELAGQPRPYPALIGVVDRQVTQVAVVLDDASVTDVPTHHVSGDDDRAVAVAFPEDRYPLEARLLDDAGELVDRLLLTLEGETVAVPIATLTRPVGPDDITEDDIRRSEREDGMPTGAGLGPGGDPARFADQFDDDVWIHLHTNVSTPGEGPMICAVAQTSIGTTTACGGVTAPLDGVVVVGRQGSGPDRILFGVVTDGYDHVLVEGQEVEVTNNVFYVTGVTTDAEVHLPSD